MDSIIKVSKRLDNLDIAKGIGIIMVVWAHGSGPLSGFIYQFHMPLFFLISGYLFNSKSTFKEFAWKRVKTLYIPFVGGNLIFYPIYIIAYKGGEFDLIHSCKIIFKIIITFEKEGYFLGATWFLPALFWISIFYKFLDRYIKESKYKRLFISVVFMVGAIIGFEITFPYTFSRVLICGLFYAVGYGVKVYKDQVSKFDKKSIAVISILIFGVIGQYNNVNMWTNTYNYKFLFE